MSDKNFKVKNGIDAAGKLTITNTSGIDSLIEVNGAGGGQFTVTPYGGISTNAGFQSIGGPSYFGGYGGATNIVVNVTGASGQTGDLQRWTTFGGTVLAKVDSTGSISATDLTLSGNLTVNGTTTNLNSTNLVIEDKNIIIADVATPTDTTADGAGITIKGATDKTFNWVNSTKSFTSSEPLIINNSSTDVATLTVKMNSSQTSNIQEWRDQNGNIVAKIGPLYGSNVFQFDPFSYGAGAGYSQILIGGRLITNEQRAAQSKFGVTTGEWALGALRATDNQVGAFAVSTTLPTFTVKAASSQTADLQQWQDSSGNILSRIGNNGTFFWGGNSYLSASLGTALIGNNYASDVALKIKGATSQTANLQEWQDSAGTVLAKIDASGYITSSSGIKASNYGYIYTSNTQGSVGFLIADGNAGYVPLVVKGVASQTADLQQWQDSSGTVVAKVDAGGFSNATGYRQIGGNSNAFGDTTTSGVVTTFGSGGNASIIPVVVKGASSQTADLQQWKNSSGTVLAKINGVGQFVSDVGFAVTAGNYGGAVGYLQASSASYVGLIIKAAASQTANLQEWQNSSGSILASVGPTGALYASVNTGSALTTPLTLDNPGSGVGTGVRLAYKYGGLNYAAIDSDYSTSPSSGSQLIFRLYDGSTLVEKLKINNQGTVSIAGFVAGAQGLIIKGATSQSADLQQWQDSTGTVLAGINSTGSFNLAAGKQVIFGSYVGTKINLGYGAAYQIGVDDYTLALEADNTSNSGKIAIRPSSATYGTSYVNPIELYANGQIKQNLTVASNVGLIIKGATSQTANLQEWQNNSGTVLASINSSGTIFTLNGGTSGVGATGRINLGDGYITKSYGGDMIFYGGLQSASEASIGTYTTNYNSTLAILALNNRIGAVIRSGSSQTTDLQQWQNNSGGILARVDQNGNIFATNNLFVRNGGNDYGAAANFGTGFNATKGFVLRGVASQTANLMEWQNSAATVLTSVDASGNITAPSYNLSDSKYLLRKTIKKTVDPAQNAVANNTYDLFDMNFPSSLQGTFYIQASIRGGGYGQNLTYSLPATYVMDWINQYPITNPFTNSTTWVDLTPLTFSPRHLMTNDYFKLQAKVNANQISFRIKLTGTLTGAPVFDIYIQHSEEFANSTITELNTTGTDATTSNVMPNFLSSKAGLSAIFNPITLYSNTSTNIPLVIRGAASQSATLQEWQNSAGTVLAKIASDGAFTVGASNFDTYGNLYVRTTSYYGANLNIRPDNTTTIGAVIRGLASQSANLQEWQNSAGTVLAKVDASGAISSSSFLSPYYQSSNSAGSYIELTGYTTYIRQRITNQPSFVISAMASQTANLQEWQNSAGTALAKLDIYGNLISSGITVSSSLGTFTNATAQFKGTSPSNAVLALQPNSGSSTGDALVYYNAAGSAVLAKLDYLGNFSAVSKSFDIPHPTKENMRLRYASLEGPENGVYIRGTIESNIIELPEYWTGLVYEDSITVSLTAVGSVQNIYVEKIEDNKVYIGGELTKAFFTVYGERKDIDKLTVEY